MEEMMNAIVFSGVGETTYTKVPKPKIQGPNDVLMKIELPASAGRMYIYCQRRHPIRRTRGSCKAMNLSGAWRK